MPLFQLCNADVSGCVATVVGAVYDNGCVSGNDVDLLDMFDKYDVLLPVVAAFKLDFGDQLVIVYDFFGVDSLLLNTSGAPFSQDGLYPTLEAGGDTGIASENDNDDTSLFDIFDKYDVPGASMKLFD